MVVVRGVRVCMWQVGWVTSGRLADEHPHERGLSSDRDGWWRWGREVGVRVGVNCDLCCGCEYVVSIVSGECEVVFKMSTTFARTKSSDDSTRGTVRAPHLHLRLSMHTHMLYIGMCRA